MKDNENNKDTILIVEDDPNNLGMLFDCLEEAGFSVLVAVDGETALRGIKLAKPDMILLDVMMPGIDGFETCRRLKERPETRDIPVIFMTALSDTTDKLKGFNAGGVDYITKPLQHEEVLARINTHLTIRRLQRELETQNIHLAQKTQELEEKTQELENANADLDAFARTVAHELKMPLTTTIGFAQIMQQVGPNLPEEKYNKYVAKILQSGERMSNITDELLLLARMKETEIRLVRLNMQAIIKECKSRLAQIIEEKQATIIMPDSWPISLGYAPWIEEVWVNYMSNGIKYGGHPPCLELGATTQENGLIRFWVRDNGPGLSSEEQNQVFAEYTRLNQLRIKGYGLGLPIVERIIHKLGGQVGLESKLGEGSTFYFTLPIAPKK